MNRTLNRQADTSQVAGRLLAIYLRDHRAGATAGLRLVRRCRDANAGSEMGETLSTLEQEIRRDCEVLEAVMAHLGVRPSRFKAIIAGAAEVAGRLKSNGRIMRRSPSSTVVELEALAAGIITKRNLWRALRAITPDYAGALDGAELDDLTKRATAQFERVVDAHGQAAKDAFGAA
ncbi:MAG TPA: hypothetical protein VFP08_12500 [Acidimicrobiales bacterium]|nr:hypothetical protein [Acidimicrobiales bacterium]